MKFLDEAKIFIASGHGGAGTISFRREKFVEFGGPDGGNGGRGGHIYVETDTALNTLIDFRYRQHFKAKRGNPGAGANKSGRAGEDITIRVPMGTQILTEDKGVLLHDMVEADQRILLAKGGDGGRGNASFKSSTNQAPRKSEPGWPGEEYYIWLRLKLLADIGLVGLPNAGKSTLLAAMTRARPKIGNYPFTTLFPMLGVAWLDGQERIIADIPGLIEGAHQGRGLGTRFLGHIERCRILIHLIDGLSDDCNQDYAIIQEELRQYGAGLMDKPCILALNKCDSMDEKTIKDKQERLQAFSKQKVISLSAISHDGLKDLTHAIFSL